MKHSYIQITLSYLAAGVIWIFTTDSLLRWLVADVERLSTFQMFKGWLFVALSTLLIYGIGRQAYHSHLAWMDERQRIFRTTVAGVYHLVLNHLNNMQFVVSEAEESGALDPELLTAAKKSSEQVRKGLLRLGQVKDVTEQSIDLAVYEDDEGSGWVINVRKVPESDA